MKFINIRELSTGTSLLGYGGRNPRGILGLNVAPFLDRYRDPGSPCQRFTTQVPRLVEQRGNEPHKSVDQRLIYRWLEIIHSGSWSIFQMGVESLRDCLFRQTLSG